MNNLTRILVVMVILILTAPSVAEAWPHERDGFLIGFNVGVGSATAKPDVGKEASGGGGAGAFRLGWAFNDQFLLGLESTFWVGHTDLEADLTLSSNKINFTWYPAAKGWFLRGGVGWGEAKLKGGLFGQTVTISDSGGTFGLGAGHEWRLTRTFALGMAVDLGSIDLETSKFDFANITAQLNWYF